MAKIFVVKIFLGEKQPKTSLKQAGIKSAIIGL